MSLYKKFDKPDECIICTENLNESLPLLPCGHWVHRDCQVKSGRKCVLCRCNIIFTSEKLKIIENYELKQKENNENNNYEHLIMEEFNNIHREWNGENFYNFYTSVRDEFYTFFDELNCSDELLERLFNLHSRWVEKLYELEREIFQRKQEQYLRESYQRIIEFKEELEKKSKEFTKTLEEEFKNLDNIFDDDDDDDNNGPLRNNIDDNNITCFDLFDDNDNKPLRHNTDDNNITCFDLFDDDDNKPLRHNTDDNNIICFDLFDDNDRPLRNN